MNNELYHYGIKRRSGRYPWGSGERPHQSEKLKGLTDEQKKRIKTGAIIAGSILGAYGSVKLIQSSAVRSMVVRGMNVVNSTPSIDDMIKNSGPEIVRKS